MYFQYSSLFLDKTTVSTFIRNWVYESRILFKPRETSVKDSQTQNIVQCKTTLRLLWTTSFFQQKKIGRLMILWFSHTNLPFDFVTVNIKLNPVTCKLLGLYWKYQIIKNFWETFRTNYKKNYVHLCI